MASRIRRWLNQWTHSSVANSTGSRPRHGPRGRITCVLYSPMMDNLMSTHWIYFLTRRFLEIARSVPDLVYALVFVFAWGLGPLAGILALAIHSMGASGKLFAEVNENIDPNPVEGIRAAGGNWIKTIRYSVVPQVLPAFASYTLWRFEINVRTAAVLGFVGAGGIGYELYTNIRLSYYEDVSAILLIIVATGRRSSAPGRVVIVVGRRAVELRLNRRNWR